MKLKVSALVVGAGAIAWASGGCFFRWLGDFAADWLILRGIQ